MNKLFLPILFAMLSTLSSCKPYDKIILEYEDFNESHITFEDVSNIEEEDYFLYFYSTHCGYCKDVKDIVLPFLHESDLKSYFIKDNGSVKRCDENSNKLCIYGIPTLVYYLKKEIVCLSSGKEEIKTFIETYVKDNEPQK